MSIVFLDRDGVINENRADYVKSLAEFRFLPGVREAIAQLTQAGHRIVVCTNQAGVAKGCISVETVEQIHRHLISEVEAYGGHIEQVYYCPHGKEEYCTCRKPRPGMLLRARDELRLDLNEAVFVGDSITDVQAGIAVGIPSMLVLTGLGIEQLRDHHHEVGQPFLVTASLTHAVEAILHGTYKRVMNSRMNPRTCSTGASFSLQAL